MGPTAQSEIIFIKRPAELQALRDRRRRTTVKDISGPYQATGELGREVEVGGYYS